MNGLGLKLTWRLGTPAGFTGAVVLLATGTAAAVTGSYLPAIFDTRNSGNYGQIQWFADNSTQKAFKTRAARPRGR
jgi:hypothetical protein